jgi:DNA mismatch repair protein MutS
MPFHSILFATPEDDVTPAPVDAPGFFGDLNLDQVVEAVTFYKRDYHLKPFFYMPLKSINAITYRHEVMQDLENEPLFDAIERFARHMHFMREHLTQVDALDYRYQKDSWFLDAVALYCDAVSVLAHDLTALSLTSRGLLAFREYLSSYAQSSQFTSLVSATKQLKTDLAAVKYCLLVTDNSIQVRKYDAEIDYSVEVEETFSKFKQGAAQDYRVEFSAGPIMNHVEAGILDLVARLYPNVFSRLDTFCAENRDYLDETISVFDREIQFYVAYLEFIARLERAGLPLCYPTLCQQEKEIYDIQGFDLMLAYKLLTTTNAPIVCSDFSLRNER